jgi:hypothetical protein
MRPRFRFETTGFHGIFIQQGWLAFKSRTISSIALELLALLTPHVKPL